MACITHCLEICKSMISVTRALPRKEVPKPPIYFVACCTLPIVKNGLVFPDHFEIRKPQTARQGSVKKKIEIDVYLL